MSTLINRREVFGLGLVYMLGRSQKKTDAQEQKLIIPTANDFAELEKQVIMYAKRYADRDYYKVKNDASLKQHERFNYREAVEDIFKYSSKPFDEEISEGPFLEMFYEEGKLKSLLFVYNTGKNESFALSFDNTRQFKETELIKQDKFGIKFVIYSGKKYLKFQNSSQVILGPEFIGLASSAMAKDFNPNNLRNPGLDIKPNEEETLEDLINKFDKNYGINMGKK